MSDTNYEPEEMTFTHALKNRMKRLFPDPNPKKERPKTRLDVEIDAAEEGRGGQDAGELGKSWDERFTK